MGLFDGLQVLVTSVATTTFGTNATWLPSAGGAAVNTNVLFSDATETAKILDLPYSPNRCLMEFFPGPFDALRQSAETGGEEIVTINGIQFGLLKVTSKEDGKTFLGELQRL